MRVAAGPKSREIEPPGRRHPVCLRDDQEPLGVVPFRFNQITTIKPTMKRFRRLLLFSGTEDNGTFALQRACQLAQENDARLTILDVLKPPPAYAQLALAFSGSVQEMHRDILLGRTEHLKEICAQQIPDDVRYSVQVVSGSPAKEIVRTVLRDNYDLVLKTADGGGILKRTLFGSTAMDLLRTCPCPVWILRPDRTPDFDRIVAAVDADATGPGAELNDAVLEISAALAELENAELHIVHAWELWMEQLLRNRSRLREEDLQAMLKEKHDQVQADFQTLLQKLNLDNDKVASHLIKGSAGFTVPEFVLQQQADLLVMGTVCRTGIEGLLIGNTAETILNDVNASVLALKPNGFRSPIALDD